MMAVLCTDCDGHGDVPADGDQYKQQYGNYSKGQSIDVVTRCVRCGGIGSMPQPVELVRLLDVLKINHKDELDRVYLAGPDIEWSGKDVVG